MELACGCGVVVREPEREALIDAIRVHAEEAHGVALTAEVAARLVADEQSAASA